MEIKPIGQIKANLGIEPNGRVQKFFTNTCYKHMDKYVPKEKLHIRVPIIKGFNTEDDVRISVSELNNMGFDNIEIFKYNT